MPELAQSSPANGIVEPPDSYITVLFCNPSLRLTKVFSNEDERIVEEGYCKAKYFDHTTYAIEDLGDLHYLINEFSRWQQVCLIRGVARKGLAQSVRRNTVNFPMPEEGAKWVCLDFDGVELPENMAPCSREAVEYAVRLLPPEFRATSYIAQFSASAGILHEDGAPYKSGLRAHVFFWLDRPVTNEELKSWLFDHPVDKSLFTAVQPHYICNPILSGVLCTLPERLFWVDKESMSVPVPALLPYARRSVKPGALDIAWEDPTGGPPSLDDLLTCEFVEWYVSNPHPEGVRYEATRAFAHNLRRVESRDWQADLQQLIPNDFPYTDTIIASDEDSRPITCEHIYRSAYQCARLNPDTGTCRINQHARTPYSLARWMNKGSIS